MDTDLNTNLEVLQEIIIIIKLTQTTDQSNFPCWKSAGGGDPAFIRTSGCAAPPAQAPTGPESIPALYTLLILSHINSLLWCRYRIQYTRMLSGTPPCPFKSIYI